MTRKVKTHLKDEFSNTRVELCHMVTPIVHSFYTVITFVYVQYMIDKLFQLGHDREIIPIRLSKHTVRSWGITFRCTICLWRT